MKAAKRQHPNERSSWGCAGCARPLPLIEQGLCKECAAKLERDLIRARDWAYSASAFLVAEDHLEALRQHVIREYGEADELIVRTPPSPQNKHSRSANTQRKRAIAAAAVRDYTLADVLQAAQRFLQAQDDNWVNLSRLGQHLYERFYHLKPKRLGQPVKPYQSLRHLLEDHPSFFQIQQDAQRPSVYWIRLTARSD
jgi:hypothetical protein